MLHLLKEHHDHPLARRFGITKTLELLCRTWTWPGMHRDANDYVHSCEICACSKTMCHKPHGPLMPLEIPTRLWGSISLDFIADLPLAKAYDSILVVVAHFIMTNKTLTAEATADLVLREVVRLHGLPDSVISDRGPRIVARFLRQSEQLGTTMNLSLGYHLQSNGQTECTNQILEQYLCCYVDYNQGNWVDLLLLAEFAHNNAHQESIKMSPFKANYGFEPRFSLNVQASGSSSPAQDRAIHLDSIRELLSDKSWTSTSNQAIFASKVYGFSGISYTTHIKIQINATPFQQGRLRLSYYPNAAASTAKVAAHLAHRTTISQLEPYRTSSLPVRTVVPPPPVIVQGHTEFFVDRILDSRLYRHAVQYKVLWEGYPENEATWEAAANARGARTALKEFHDSYPQKPMAPLVKEVLEGDVM